MNTIQMARLRHWAESSTRRVNTCMDVNGREGGALCWWWRKNKGGQPDAHRVVVRARRSCCTPFRQLIHLQKVYRRLSQEPSEFVQYTRVIDTGKLPSQNSN